MSPALASGVLGLGRGPGGGGPPGGGGDGGGTPIVMPRKQNPANRYLQSRFGYLGEGSTISSNFF